VDPQARYRTDEYNPYQEPGGGYPTQNFSDYGKGQMDPPQMTPPQHWMPPQMQGPPPIQDPRQIKDMVGQGQEPLQWGGGQPQMQPPQMGQGGGMFGGGLGPGNPYQQGGMGNMFGGMPPGMGAKGGMPGQMPPQMQGGGWGMGPNMEGWKQRY
jgi:hypothetical protein